MSNALYYMYAKILKDSLKVNANLVKENVTVLEGLMMDKEVIEIIDVKAKLLDPTLTALQNKCTESVISYI